MIRFLRPWITSAFALVTLFSTTAAAQVTTSYAYDGFHPEDGLWFNPDEPGSGLTLDYQESIMDAAFGTLVVALYSYRADGSPVWYLASGRIDKETLIFEADLNEFAGGSCIECTPYVETAVSEPPRSIAIEFASPNSAILRIDDSDPVSIVTFLFGTVSFDIRFIFDSPRETIPGVFGRWIFVDVKTGEVIANVTLEQLIYLDPGGVAFESAIATNSEGDRFFHRFICQHIESGMREPYCSLQFGSRPPGEGNSFETTDLFTSYLGDISPHRISGFRGGPILENEFLVRGEEPVWAFRLPWLESDLETEE